MALQDFTDSFYQQIEFSCLLVMLLVPVSVCVYAYVVVCVCVRTREAVKNAIH